MSKDNKLWVAIDRDALRALIREVLREEYPELQTQKEIYSEKEFCELVGISQSTARKLRDRGELRFKRVGRRILYSRKHVKEFLKGKQGKRKRRSPAPLSSLASETPE